MSDKKVILPESQEELIEKWMPVIEGTGKWEKVVEGMPVVESKGYANLATQLEILEQVELKESTQTGSVANYTPVLIPMVRRIMPALIGNEIFGVQPMTGPSGLIFSLKSLYQGAGTDAVSANYEILVVADSSVVPSGTTVSATGDDGVGVVIHEEDNMILIKITSGSFATATGIDDTGTWAANVTTVTKAFPNGEALASVVFKSFSGSMNTATGESLGSATKEMGFEINSSPVTAKTRKLKTRWTIELEDDLRAVHGMNAEQLLSGFCGDEIVKEMNREFIDAVKGYAATAGTIAPATWTYDTSDDTQGRWENEKYLSLANEVARQSALLATATLRGPANWMIVTLGVQKALEATGRLKPSGGIANPLGNAFVGTFDGMKVYVDMFPTETGNFVYFGYKGSEVDAGMYYCPYVPLKVNKGYGEEDNIPRLFFSTRYGISENPYGGKQYFQKLTVADLPGA